MTQAIPTLDYTDRPPGSRLIVRRDAGGLSITDPPTGLWHQLRGVLFIYAVLTGLFAVAALFAWRNWTGGFPPITPRSTLAIVLKWLLDFILDLEVLIPLCIMLVVFTLIGRTSHHLHADREQLVMESRGRWWGNREWSRRRVIPRAEIGDIRTGGFGTQLLILSPANKRMVAVSLTRRADTRWSARALRQELRIPNPAYTDGVRRRR